jgi:hypothetical protein
MRRSTCTTTPSASNGSYAALSSGLSSDPTGPRVILHQPWGIAWIETRSTPPRAATYARTSGDSK